MRAWCLAVVLTLLVAATGAADVYNLGNADVSSVRLWGPTDLANLGYSVVVGDFDGDGQNDLAAGAPGDQSLRGTVHVMLSSEGYLDRDIDLAEQDAHVRIHGESDQYAGYHLAAGDFNGDGIDDLAVGAARAPGPSGEAQLGAVFVYFGRETWPATLGTTTGADATVWGEKANGQFGARLATGDFDGDGLDDLFISAPVFQDVGAFAAGKVYGLTGARLDGVIDLRDDDIEADVEIVGEENGQRLGQGLALGDLDGDGLADVALGAPSLAPPLPGAKEGFAGAAYVVLGRELTTPLRLNLASDTADVRLQWQDQVGNLGAALTVGDLNGDGLGDLIVAAPNLPTKSAAGEIFVVNGQYNWPATIDLSVADLTIHGGSEGDRFGFALAVGDVSGDCVDDLIIGAPRVEALGKSHVYVVAGNTAFPSQYDIDLAAGDEALHTFTAAVARDQAGFALASGDLDADGVWDVIIGARTAEVGDPARDEGGAVFAVLSDATNQEPVADAGPDRESVPSVPVVFDGRASADPEGAALTYQWSQIDGPETVTIHDGDTATPLVVPTELGVYHFALVVADCAAAGEADEVELTVKDFTGDDDTTGDDDAADDDASDDDASDDDTAGDDDDGGGADDDREDDAGITGGGGCTG